MVYPGNTNMMAADRTMANV